MPGSARALRYSSISGVWSVLRFGQMPGYTQDGRRQADSISRLLHASRYMFAVGPPRSEITPVKPGTVSRIVSISRNDRVFRAALDDAALVLGDRAERAAAEAAALDRDREADHLVRRDLRVAVGRMRLRAVRQLVDAVHLLRGQRNRRRVEPHVARRRGAAPARARCRDWSPDAGCARRARTAPGRRATCS